MYELEITLWHSMAIDTRGSPTYKANVQDLSGYKYNLEIWNTYLWFEIHIKVVK